MAAAITNFTVHEADTGLTQVANSPFAYKEIIVVAPATADDGDTIAVDLSLYGMSTFKSIIGWTHSTDYNVIITEAPTTTVSGTTVTITIGGSTDNKLRAFLVGGY